MCELSRRHLRLAVPCLLLVLAAGCSARRFDRPESGSVQRGIASWYGEPFHGRQTASGEVYDMHGLSAAHRELPLGTRVEVTNLENGRRVELVINDRGPFVRGRVLDLSYGAAKKLGTVQAGLAKVEIRVLEMGGGRPGPSLATAYTVQVGAFRDRRKAEELEERLRRDRDSVRIEEREGWYRVRIGDFSTDAEARELQKRLRAQGFQALVIPLR